MTGRSGPHQPTPYELRFGGHLDPRWSSWFDGLTLTHENNGTTTLRGSVTDQAELYGLLCRVRDLGVVLISVQRIESVDDPAGHLR